MEHFYNSLQSGDLIYVRVVVSGPSIQQNRLALCRILKKEIEVASGTTNYVFTCKVIQQWFPDYGPITWVRKRIRIGCPVGIAYPGMWHIYSVEEFERNHNAVRERRIRREKNRAKRQENTHKLFKGIGISVVLIFLFYVLWLVISAM